MARSPSISGRNERLFASPPDRTSAVALPKIGFSTSPRPSALTLLSYELVKVLDSIFDPVSREDFFRNYWTKAFLHIPGPPDKFSRFFPWELLNRTLEEHTFDSRRLRLVKSGETLETSRYLNGSRVNAASLLSELSNGATLILNTCDEVSQPAKALAVELERLIHRKVMVNLYAGWRHDNGFDVHWDDHDVLILQVAGRKHWKVWNPTRLYPFKTDLVDTSLATHPTDEPMWDAMVEPGSLLYIPRGWWHVAFPVDEPTLHLTVSATNWNGIDLLKWLANNMKSSAAARMELPLLASGPDERKEWLDRVQADLTAAWDDDLIERFLVERDSEAAPRPRLSLPAEADPRHSKVSRTTLLELAIPRLLHFSFPKGTAARNGNASLRVNEKIWQMDCASAEVIQRFNDFQPHTLADLAPGADFRVLSVVGTLVMAGVLRRVL